jgi:hypothetical protein
MMSPRNHANDLRLNCNAGDRLQADSRSERDGPFPFGHDAVAQGELPVVSEDIRVRAQRPGSWQEAVGYPDRPIVGTALQSTWSHLRFFVYPSYPYEKTPRRNVAGRSGEDAFR